MAKHDTLRGQLIEAETRITVHELCRHCTVRVEEVITYVHEGILDPQDEAVMPEKADTWQFHISSVRRVQTAVHLQRDLGVNLAGAGVARPDHGAGEDWRDSVTCWSVNFSKSTYES